MLSICSSDIAILYRTEDELTKVNVNMGDMITVQLGLYIHCTDRVKKVN